MELPVQTEAELDAQGRRRRFVFGGSGPAQEDQPVAGLRAHLQASNLFLSGLGKPGDQQAGRVRLDQLLGPASIADPAA